MSGGGGQKGRTMGEKANEKISEWLLDISKYITTAVVVASFFDAINNVAVVFSVGMLAAVAALIGSILLTRK